MNQETAEVQRIYNTVIQHAISLGLEASDFLRCWNEGDWSACREFDFTDSSCMEEMK